MTFTKKSELTDLSIAQVSDIAKTIGIECGPDDELSRPDAIKLGTAVKKFQEDGSQNLAKEDKKVFRIWTAGKNKTVFLGEKLGSIKVRDHSLVLDGTRDADTIKIIGRLKNVLGMFQVIDKPFEEYSDESEKFEDRLRELVYTGAGQEESRGGIKAVRALFSAEQLSAMGEKAFSGKTLIKKAVNSKSIIHLHNV